jgi:hypothetical protein
MPLRDVALMRAQGDLRVDRRRAPDAPAREERHGVPVRHGAKRSGQKSSRFAFASQRVKLAAV